MTRWLKYASPAVGVVMLIVAIVALRKAFDSYQYRDIIEAFSYISGIKVAVAICFTAMSYLTLTSYDYMGLRYIRHRLPFLKVAMTSFIAYAFGYTIGFSFLSGASVRYRLYSTSALSATQIGKVAIFCGVSAWMGFLCLGGTALLLSPASLIAQLPVPIGAPRYVGAAAVALVLFYILATFVIKKKVRLQGVELYLPRPGLVITQVLAASLDLAIAGGVLFVLLPPDAAIGYVGFMGIFLVAMSMGILSQVPGGLGVFELIMITLLSPVVPAGSIVGALLAFRVVYYLMPFAAAIVLFASFEAHQGRAFLSRTAVAWLPFMGK